MVSDVEVEYIARALERIHWDGTGCGTHGVNACSNCFGPSPMSSHEVVRFVLETAAREYGTMGE